MNRLGMIVRADGGGLASMTYEAWRHLKPEKTLIVLTDHKTRGTADVRIFNGGSGEVRSCRMMPGREDVNWLLDGADVLYTAETWYSQSLPMLAKRRGVKTVLHAMPEMHAIDTADVMLVPTTWRMDLVPGCQVLTVPVALDQFKYEPRRRCETLYHIASNAMCDRNGTDLLFAALPHVENECHLQIRGENRYVKTGSEIKIGNVMVEGLGHSHGPYWKAWPGDPDVFISPRRFGGLSLPMNEASAQGIPTISLDLEPQRGWFPSEAFVPAYEQTRGVRMRGGSVDVFQGGILSLAHKIDQLVSDPELVRTLSDSAYAWAAENSWEKELYKYEELMRY